MHSPIRELSVSATGARENEQDNDNEVTNTRGRGAGREREGKGDLILSFLRLRNDATKVQRSNRLTLDLTLRPNSIP